MKKIFFMSIFLSVNAFAADLNLNGGESAMIQANVRTTVTCGGSSSGSGGSCEDAIAGLSSLIDACKGTYSGASCVDKYWPNFKKENPRCAMSAISVCIDNCKTTYSPASCADKCSK
ncbi:MAG TPA: hypothetical protein VN132_06185 [Bdellovibrio sp.]|nr:hypothetical protein [Bdellovibrio sp.]